jgi:tRNA-splicing ligase RtcB
MRIEKQGETEIKLWTTSPKGDVPVEAKALEQLRNIARLPFVFRHVAAMPDVTWGWRDRRLVIATRGAIVPAAVGVDIGCGMEAVRTSLGERSADSLAPVRNAIERPCPTAARTRAGRATAVRGTCRPRPSPLPGAGSARTSATSGSSRSTRRSTATRRRRHLGTLGTGNHFIELCLDEADRVWSCSTAAAAGSATASAATSSSAPSRRSSVRAPLPDPDLSYLPESSKLFADYVAAVGWAQDYAAANRRQMLRATTGAVERALGGRSPR